MKHISHKVLKAMFSEFLEETQGNLKLCGDEYPMAETLELLNPKKYEELFSNYLESQVKEENLYVDEDGEFYDSPICTHEERDHGVCCECGEQCDYDPRKEID